MGNIIAGSLPATPLLNSNYDASFIAGILQLRYIYSMSVERIIKLFAENEQVHRTRADPESGPGV